MLDRKLLLSFKTVSLISMFVVLHPLLTAAKQRKRGLDDAESGGGEKILQMEDGIWTAPHVKQWRLDNGARVFELVPEHRVVVMPLPSFGHQRALSQLTHCETGWDEIAAFEPELGEDPEINAFRCVPTGHEAAEGLREINTDSLVQENIQEVFNVHGPCKHIRQDIFSEWFSATSSSRMWLTALHPGMPPDQWHADGCYHDPRPAGDDFITFLSYPHSEWNDEWGGALEFSEKLCMASAVRNYQTSVVMRVTPRPDIMIAFSGNVIHRATHPNKKAPKNMGPSELLRHEENNQPKNGAAWRYSMVLQLTCPNGRFNGPYHAKILGITCTFPGAQYFVEGVVAIMCAVFVVFMVLHWRESSIEIAEARKMR